MLRQTTALSPSRPPSLVCHPLPKLRTQRDAAWGFSHFDTALPVFTNCPCHTRSTHAGRALRECNVAAAARKYVATYPITDECLRACTGIHTEMVAMLHSISIRTVPLTLREAVPRCIDLITQFVKWCVPAAVGAAHTHPPNAKNEGEKNTNRRQKYKTTKNTIMVSLIRVGFGPRRSIQILKRGVGATVAGSGMLSASCVLI